MKFRYLAVPVLVMSLCVLPAQGKEGKNRDGAGSKATAFTTHTDSYTTKGTLAPWAPGGDAVKKSEKPGKEKKEKAEVKKHPKKEKGKKEHGEKNRKVKSKKEHGKKHHGEKAGRDTGNPPRDGPPRRRSPRIPLPTPPRERWLHGRPA